MSCEWNLRYVHNSLSVGAQQQTLTSRRNHERCKQASLASHSERGGFCNIGSCGCLYTYNCLYCKRYSATQNLPMMPVYIRGSVRERRSKAKRLRQFRHKHYLLHIAEDSKGKALSEADASLRSSQSRSGRHILPSRRSERRSKAKSITNLRACLTSMLDRLEQSVFYLSLSIFLYQLQLLDAGADGAWLTLEMGGKFFGRCTLTPHLG